MSIVGRRWRWRGGAERGGEGSDIGKREASSCQEREMVVRNKEGYVEEWGRMVERKSGEGWMSVGIYIYVEGGEEWRPLLLELTRVLRSERGVEWFQHHGFTASVDESLVELMGAVISLSCT